MAIDLEAVADRLEAGPDHWTATERQILAAFHDAHDGERYSTQVAAAIRALATLSSHEGSERG